MILTFKHLLHSKIMQFEFATISSNATVVLIGKKTKKLYRLFVVKDEKLKWVPGQVWE